MVCVCCCLPDLENMCTLFFQVISCYFLFIVILELVCIQCDIIPSSNRLHSHFCKYFLFSAFDNFYLSIFNFANSSAIYNLLLVSSSKIFLFIPFTCRVLTPNGLYIPAEILPVFIHYGKIFLSVFQHV